MNTETNTNTNIKVVVTGSNSGIGEAVCSLLSSKGYIVVGLDLSSGVDVSSVENVQSSLVQHTDARALINCAGIGDAITFHKENALDIIHKVMNVNFFGTVNTCHTLFKHMRDNPQQCSIVNISSLWGHKGTFAMTGYCASKHAVVGFTRSLQAEGAGKGILSSAICPTYVATPILEGLKEEVKQKLIDEHCPTGDLLSVTEVAEKIVNMTEQQLYGVSQGYNTDEIYYGL